MRSPGLGLAPHSPTISETATRKSPIEINTIIRRALVLKSGHNQNVTIMVIDPRIDSEAAEVDRALVKVSSAIRVCPFVVGVSEEFVSI